MYGMLTTGGGLVFTSDQDRRFYALDQWTGETLWQTILASSSYMAPISYAVDGRQYVAVITPGGSVPPTQSGVGHTMFVFTLPER
jgi:alcohol dehydrogenase (cytochrome c)